MRTKSNLKTILIWVAIFAIMLMLVSSLLADGGSEKVTYSDVVRYFEENRVTEFVVGNDNILTMKLKPEKEGDKETTVYYKLESVDHFRLELGETIRQNAEEGTLKKYEYEPAKTWPWWVQILPWILVIIVIAGLWMFMIAQMKGGQGGGRAGNFAKARTKTPADAKSKVTFADVAGADEEKEELEEIVEFLKNPQKFSTLGAKIPHGVLLMGPPGTGKTLLAKAVAGEAGVPFFSISGSDFVEMYVGVGASRVRDLFETARKAPASIVFIDEIDAVGRHRGAGLGGGHDEREQTLNQLLVEMDGFGSHEGIIVIAATNRSDILDPALLRPGRFDRQIVVNPPDIKGREDILKVHARNKKFEPEVDFATIAKTTSGFTGADLANLLNEAALLAARRGKSLIGMHDIEDAFTKVIAGPQKKSRRMKESEKRKTAYHEAGHALLAYYLPTCDPVHSITIIPSGNALGYTLSVPEEDKYSVYKQELKEQISMLLGGRAAEMLVFGDYSGGASNDIQRATSIARTMVTKLGMSEALGPIRFGSSHGDDVFLGRDFSATQDYSNDTAAKIDAEIARIIDESFTVAKDTLREHSDKLRLVAEFLVTHETMDGDQFRAAMEGDPTFEELEAIITAKKEKSRAANAAEREAEKKAAEERAAREAKEAAQNATASSEQPENPYDAAPESKTDTADKPDGE